VGIVENTMRPRHRLCTTIAALLVLFTIRLAAGQSNQEWIALKTKCGLSPSLLYNDWAKSGSPCPAANATKTGPTTLNPALENAAQTLGYAVGQWLGNALFGSGNTATNAADSADTAAQQQRVLAAQQLNDSGIYLLKQKNYAAAINTFNQALAQTPGDANILHNLEEAKQRQKNAAVAGKTSGALGELLGTAPSGVLNSAGPLNLVNLDSDPNSMNLRDSARTSPGSLQGQIDGVFASDIPASAGLTPQVIHPQAADIEQIFQPQQSAPSPSQMGAEQKQLDDIFKDSGGTADSAALARQANIGQKAVAARSDEDASSLSRQGFDTAAPTVTVTQTKTTQAQGAVALATTSSSVVDLSQSKQPLVPENLKTPQIPSNAVPEGARLPISAMKPTRSDGFAASGAPVFDCVGDRAAISRLAVGLPTQDEAIRRTEAAMAAAKADGDEPRRQAMFAAVLTLLSSATTVSNWAETVIAKEESLKSAGISADAAAQFKFLQRSKKILEVSNTLVDLTANARRSYEAGKVFGNAVLVQKTATTLIDEIEATRKLLVDSGLKDKAFEEGAAKIALIGFGPVGGPTVAALVHTIASGIDLYINSQQAWNSAREAEQADQDLTSMRYQQMLVRSRIYELQQEVAVGCSVTR
jgi:tetratricopeptide (TPR) repeat protein